MESEADKDSIYTPKLPLFSSPRADMHSPERSGMLTPPLQASVSVPFRWEDEPGKPKPCTTLTIFSINNPNDFAAKCLELPPRLLHDHAKNTTVSESARLQSSSSSPFRIGSECYGSFRAGSVSPENMQLGTMILSKRSGNYKEQGLFSSWKKRAFKARDSDVFPSFGDRDSECSAKEEENNTSTSVKITITKRVHSKSKIWASIYEGLKLAVPWSKKGKKDGFMG